MSMDALGLASEAFRRGELSHARTLVAKVLLEDPVNEQAWLLMARLVKDRPQVIECLERASKINPANVATQAALQAMKRVNLPQEASATASRVLASSPAREDLRVGASQASPSVGVKSRQLTLPEAAPDTIQLSKRKSNKPLIFGSLIVFMIILIALIGPTLAPHDPMEEHAIFQLGDKWIVPPVNAFQVPGFILGTDIAGRDMLSRILYAVRPTMIMVSIVAIVRLLLGTLIGLFAGWSTGRTGTFLSGLISAALSVPTLLVALGAITAVGAESGLVAFIIGLSINGWGETARLVHEQTQVIKRQLFIESARSLGASTFHILTRHILRQVMPMIWMLFAFEISGTLMVTAGLGFLGYYIGGDVWIDWADFVARRTSGAPELGQMLATSWSKLLQSWPLVITGLVIFITVLGFNLLGEGLRSRLNPEYIDRNSRLAVLNDRFSLWFAESVSYPTSRWFKANRLRPAMVILAVFALTASVYIYKAKNTSRFIPSQATLAIPGGQIWAAEKVDPYGTYYLNFIGPVNPILLWTVNRLDGFSGSPVIAADGTIYVASLDGTLLALNPDGTTRWQASLPETPIGPLTIGPEGTIYVTDDKAGLTAFNQDGSQLWTFPVEVNGKPNHGAIVDQNGTIYYLIENQLGDILVALQPNGQLLWSTRPGTRAAATGLRLSPDGKQIFVKDVEVNAQDGTLVVLTLPTDDNLVLAEQAHILVGADGKTYLLAGHVVMQWTETSQGFNLEQKVDWNFRGEGFNQSSNLPVEGGVTPKGIVWLFYSGLYGGISVYWLDLNGQIINSYTSELSKSGRVVSIDGEGTLYTCRLGFSDEQGTATMCEAYHQDTSTPAWTYTFIGDVEGVVGTAMAPGRMYVITSDGNLTALGDSNTSQPSPVPSP